MLAGLEVVRTLNDLGIETEGVANQLHDLGCGTGQGYLFDRPLDGAALTARLQAPGVKVPA